MRKVYNLRVECDSPKYSMTDDEFCNGLEECIADEFGDEMKYVKLKAEPIDKDYELAEKDKEIEELNLPIYNSFDTPDAIFTSKNGDIVRLRIGATYINVLINDEIYFQELAIELNYIKACKICKKLFLGEAEI